MTESRAASLGSESTLPTDGRQTLYLGFASQRLSIRMSGSRRGRRWQESGSRGSRGSIASSSATAVEPTNSLTPLPRQHGDGDSDRRDGNAVL